MIIAPFRHLEIYQHCFTCMELRCLLTDSMGSVHQMSGNNSCCLFPQALPKLRTVEWMPYVVLIKPTDVDSMRQMNLQAINDGVDTQRKSVSFGV